MTFEVDVEIISNLVEVTTEIISNFIEVTAEVARWASSSAGTVYVYADNELIDTIASPNLDTLVLNIEF